MKNICCISIFVLSLSNLNGQTPTFEWAKQMGGEGLDVGLSIAVDPYGNVYTVGHFSDTADFDPGTDTFSLATTLGSISGNFISKLDSGGNLLWAKQVEGAGSFGNSEVTCDHIGNVYVTGSFNGTYDFDPSPDTFILTSEGVLYDLFVYKLDFDGNFVWAKVINGTVSARGLSIVTDDENNVYVTGFFRGILYFNSEPDIFTLNSAGDTDIFILKLDADGSFVWAKAIGGESINADLGLSIALDNSGNIFTTGVFNATVDFDPGPGTYTLIASSFGSAFILKLDNDGNFVWAKGMGEIDYTQGESIAIDTYNNVYTLGEFRGTVDFDPGPDTFNLTSSQGNSEPFITKFDAEGNFVWAKQYGVGLSCTGNSINVDGNGNVYTTGYFRETVDFDPNPGVFNLSANGFYDAYISKLDTEGNFVWAGKLSGESWDMGNSITLDNFGNIYTTGLFTSTADFDPGPSAFHLTSFGSRDIFVHKMKQCLSEATISSEGGDFEICKGDSLDLTVNEGVTYSWSTGDTMATIQIAPEFTTSYSVTLTDANECVYTDIATVTVHDLPEVFIEGESEVCEGANLTLTASGGEEYAWSTGESNASIIVFPPVDTVYHVTATDSFGCSNSDTVSVAVLPLPEVNISGETEVCPGDTILLTSSGGLEYLWNTGDITEAIEISLATSSDYSVTVTDANGCTASTSVIVDVNTDYCPPCVEYAMPNVFTPGDDGLNDLFYVAIEGEAIVREFRIYSRWGNQVHHSSAPWDGTQNGHPLPSDVYIYMVTLETNCGIKQLRGEVSLLR